MHPSVVFVFNHSQVWSWAYGHCLKYHSLHVLLFNCHGHWEWELLLEFFIKGCFDFSCISCLISIFYKFIYVFFIYSFNFQKNSWRSTLILAYQSLGVVYGDLSISPLYVFKSTFAEDISHSYSNVEVFGVLSFVFWTLTLIPLLKYVFIVLRADDNGEGQHLIASLSQIQR